MSRARMRGIIAGAAILTLFGGWWCIAALAYWAGRPDWSIATASVTTVVLLVLCVTRLVASTKIPTVDDPVAAAKGKRAGRLFGIIFGIEGGLIALCSGEPRLWAVDSDCDRDYRRSAFPSAGTRI